VILTGWQVTGDGGRGQPAPVCSVNARTCTAQRLLLAG